MRKGIPLLLAGLLMFQFEADAQERGKIIFEIGMSDIACVLSLGPTAPEVRARAFIMGDVNRFLMARSRGETEYEPYEDPGPIRFFAAGLTEQKYLNWLGWFDQVEPTVHGGLIKKRFLIRLKIDGVKDELPATLGLTTGNAPLDGYLMFSIPDSDYQTSLAAHPICEDSNGIATDHFRAEYKRTREHSRRFIEKYRKDNR